MMLQVLVLVDEETEDEQVDEVFDELLFDKFECKYSFVSQLS